MSHFTKALEEGESFFDDKFPNTKNMNLDISVYHATMQDISTHRKDMHNFLTQFAEKIRQAVAEDDVGWAEGKKIDMGCAHDQDGGCYAGKFENELCTPSYNQALTDFITHKREQLTKE